MHAVLAQDWLTNVHELAVIVNASIAESRDGVLQKPTSEDIVWRKKPKAVTNVTQPHAQEVVGRHKTLQEAADELGLSRYQLRRLLRKGPSGT